MTDKDLKQHVQNALDWDPSVDSSDIGVAVDEGVVTLRGTVRSYAEKVTAEKVTIRLFGTKGVANDLVVHVPSSEQRTDTEIAQAAVNALKWSAVTSNQRVTVAVGDGWITLDGTVDWGYQKDAAARAVRDLTGVKGLVNRIVVQSPIRPVDVSEKIEAAFKRSAEIDARRIQVTAKDGKVILSGNVRSWVEREEAERAAWAAPGVRHVDDRLAIVP